jgi:translation initiation factor IF-1
MKTNKSITHQPKNNEKFLQTRGVVIKRVRNNVFLVKCDNGKIITTDIAARFRTASGKRKARITANDRVLIEIPLIDLEKGQIVSLVEENN